MKSIINDKGEETTNQDEIKQEVYTFYKNLYDDKEENITDIDLNSILKPDTPKLTDEESKQLEGKITLEEIGTAIKNLDSLQNFRNFSSKT